MNKRAIDERFSSLAVRIEQANFLLEVIAEIPTDDPQCARRRNAFFGLLFEVLRHAREDFKALSPAVNALLFGGPDSPKEGAPRG